MFSCTTTTSELLWNNIEPYKKWIGQGYKLTKPYTVLATVRNKSVEIDMEVGLFTDLMSGSDEKKAELEYTDESHAVVTITHDRLYANPWVKPRDGSPPFKMTRKEVDNLLLEMMIEEEPDLGKCHEVYFYVRNKAAPAWYMHRVLGFFRIPGHIL